MEIYANSPILAIINETATTYKGYVGRPAMIERLEKILSLYDIDLDEEAFVKTHYGTLKNLRLAIERGWTVIFVSSEDIELSQINISASNIQRILTERSYGLTDAVCEAETILTKMINGLHYDQVGCYEPV